MPKTAQRQVLIVLIMLGVCAGLGHRSKPVNDRSKCSISSTSHGSMLALSEDMELVNGQFMVSCRVPEARYALDVCKIELAIDDQTGMSQVSQQECSSAETWLAEGNTRVVAVRSELSNLTPGLYDFHVRIWCAGVLQAQITSSVVVMYPDFRLDECVPALVIPNEPECGTCQDIMCGVNATVVWKDCGGAEVIQLRAQYFLRNCNVVNVGQINSEIVHETINYTHAAAISEDAKQLVYTSMPKCGVYKLDMDHAAFQS